MTTLTEPEKIAGDVASATILVGSMINWLPAIAAIFTIVWTCMRIMESRVFLYWYKKVIGAEAPWAEEDS